MFPSLLVENNVIGNPTAGSVDQVYSVGITAQGSGTTAGLIGVIRGNIIYVEGWIPTSSNGNDTGIDVGRYQRDRHLHDREKQGQPRQEQ